MHKKINTLIRYVAFTICACLCHPTLHATASVVSEALEMSVERIPVFNTAGDLIDLHIRIQYRDNMEQKDYPDFIALRDDLQKWIAGYNWTPVENEPPVYWETMIKDLATMVLRAYQDIRIATLSVDVYPKSNYNFIFSVASTATRAADSAIRTNESITITLPTRGLDFQGPQVIELETTLHYAKDLGIRDYPTLRLIHKAIIDGIENYPVKTDYWETLIKAVSRDILVAFPAYAGIDMDLNVYPTSTVDYFHRVFCSTVRE